MSGITVTKNQISDRWVALTVEGEIDLATVDEISDAIDTILAADAGDLVVDLTKTEFMDSTGLRALIVADRSFKESNRSFAIVVAQGPISRLIDLSGVGASLRVVADLPELDKEPTPSS